MKFILAICLFFSLHSRAQTFVDLALEAGQYFQNGEYEKAIPIAEKCAAEVDKMMGRDNIIYQGMLFIQAWGHAKAFRYEKAESLYTQLCGLHRGAADSEKKKHFATCLNNLATLYSDMGQFEKAERLLIESADLTKELTGEKDSNYAYSLNNLAALYHAMGQYQKAEPLYTQAIEVRKTVYGTKHPSYATSLNNLGTLYLEMGHHKKAETLFLQSRDIRKQTLGEKNTDYAMSLNNLGSLYEQMEQYARAEPFYIQSNNIYRSINGENHPDYAMGLNNLASLYTQQKQFKKAEPLMVQARNIWKSVLGDRHPNYATATNNLAAFYRKSRTRYVESEQLYQEAIRLRKESLGTGHPLTGDTENDLALLYSNLKQYDKAEPLLISSSRSLLNNLQSSFTVLSEKEKADYLDYNFVYTETNNSFLFNHPQASNDLKNSSYDLQLGFKAASLADTRNVFASVRQSQDNSIRQLFEKWKLNRVILSKQYALPVSSRIPDLSKIEDETESIEKELNRLSGDFREQQTELTIGTKEVEEKLGNAEAAIEFVRFRLYTDRWADTVVYAAYLLRKGDQAPVFVPLCFESAIDKLSNRPIRTATTLAKLFYAPNEFRKSGIPTAGDSLYNLVWKPLEKHLDGIEKISYSPAGKLFGIAFHALPVDSSSLLADHYQLEQYTSTRQIALRNDQPDDPSTTNVVLFGDAQFTMDSIQLTRKAIQQKMNTNSTASISTERGARGGMWMGLPGTAEEVKKIGQLFQSKQMESQAFLQSDASEENLKLLSGQSPRVLHIATHGFFLPEANRQQREKGGNSYVLAHDPLLRSGLILAGGNYAWSGKTPINGIEDGVATAYEISQLNLGNTALVVLSACETALGDVKGSEGVFGLQRSFKMAGVKNLVVSLWQVPDKETVELMTQFYTHYMSGKPVSESFNLAQSEMRKKYAPFYWAAFVLVE